MTVALLAGVHQKVLVVKRHNIEDMIISNLLCMHIPVPILDLRQSIHTLSDLQLF